jgi:hypothetical protein
LSSQGLSQIFHSLSLSSSSRAFRGAAIVEVESTTKSSVAAISERGDNQARRVAKVLIVVVKGSIDHPHPSVAVLPIVAHLRLPCKIRDFINALNLQLVYHIPVVNIKNNEGFDSASVERTDV